MTNSHLSIRSLLTVINSDKYGDFEEEFWLYSFHPSIREYLEKKANTEGLSLDSNYDGRFCDYYLGFITDCYQSIGKETYFSFIRCFNIITQSKNNDIHKVISLINDIKQKSRIFRMLGAIYYSQGMYQTSVEYYEQALVIHKEIGDKGSDGR